MKNLLILSCKQYINTFKNFPIIVLNSENHCIKFVKYIKSLLSSDRERKKLTQAYPL